MKTIADISSCENEEDKILSVCQCGPDGDIEHEIIIQRGLKEYDFMDDAPGPKIWTATQKETPRCSAE